MAVELQPSPDPLRPVRPILFTYQKRKKPTVPSPPAIASTTCNTSDKLSLCHGCLVNHIDLGSNSLFLFRSHWRLLLLCGTCFPAIKSGEFCSYCLKSKPEDVGTVDVSELEFLQCGSCLCRVHRCCIPREHRFDYATWKKLSGKDGTFTCIDCSPAFNLYKRSKNGGVFEVITEEINADVAIGVLSEKKEDDLNMAIQVHLAINGSHRVSKKSLNSGSKSKLKNCESEKPRKKKPPLNPNRVNNHRVIFENLSGIKYGPGSVVLALESLKAIGPPLIKDSVFKEDLKKEEQNEDLKTGTESSNLNDRYEIKYKRKKLLLLGDSTGTEEKKVLLLGDSTGMEEKKLLLGDLTGTEEKKLLLLGESSGTEKKQLLLLGDSTGTEKKNLLLLGDSSGTERKNCVNYSNYNESTERKTGTDENRDEKGRYEKKYKRRKCLQI